MMSYRTKKSVLWSRVIEEIQGAATDVASSLVDLTNEVVGVCSGPDLFQQRLRGLSWTDCVVRAARCSAAVFEECDFSRVVFTDCELSGTSFVECRFRDCFVLGGKSGTLFSVVDCSIIDLVVSGLRADRVEFQGGTVKHLAVTGSTFDQLSFAGVSSPRRVTGSVVMTDLSLDSVGGISQLAKAGVEVAIDSELWSLFGDLLLRQIGLECMDPVEAKALSEGLGRR